MGQEDVEVPAGLGVRHQGADCFVQPPAAVAHLGAVTKPHCTYKGQTAAMVGGRVGECINQSINAGCSAGLGDGCAGGGGKG